MTDIPDDPPDGANPESASPILESMAGEDTKNATPNSDLSKEEADRLWREAHDEAVFGDLDPHAGEMWDAIGESNGEAPHDRAHGRNEDSEDNQNDGALAEAEQALILAQMNYRRALDAHAPGQGMTEINAAEEALYDATVALDMARLPAPDDHLAWIIVAAAIAVEAIVDWAEWHIKRATDRMIWKKDPGLQLIIEAAEEIEFMFGGANPTGYEEDEFEGYFPSLEARNTAVDDAFAKLREGITRASDTAESARIHEDAAVAQLRDDQAIELETSHLRPWIRVLRFIDDAYREAALAPTNELYWRLQVLEELSSHRCPPIARWFK